MTTDTTSCTDGACTSPKRSCCAPRAWRCAAGISATIVSVIVMTAAVAKLAGPSLSKFITIGGQDYLVDTIAGPIEFTIVIAILLGFRMRLCWLCVAAMFGGFAGYSLSYFMAKESCGCFGSLLVNTPFEFLSIKGVSTIIDVAFVLAAIGLLAWRGRSCMRWPAAAVVLALLAGTGGFFYANHDRAKAIAYEKEQRDKALNPDPVPAPPNDATPADTPPAVKAFTDAHSVLFNSNLLTDIRAQPPGGPAWYIFVYDPNCSECMELHPYFEMDQARFETTDDPIMRIRMFTKQQLESDGIIGFWAWPTGASMLLIRDGVLTNVYSHEHEDAQPTPDMIYEDLEVDNLLPNYPLVSE